MKRFPLLLGAVVLAGCGGDSESSFPTVGAARVYEVTGFVPAGAVQPGVVTRLSFAIRRPDGTPLVRYRRGGGPHTGVHVIIVSADLRTIIHRHPPVRADGTVSAAVTFPTPGRYRVVIDAFPAGERQSNFQLFRTITVEGTPRRRPLPPTTGTAVVDGYRFTIRKLPRLKAIQAALLDVEVTDPAGRPARFTTYFGALAHAIFFRRGSLDYFHTHVCAPGAAECTSAAGGAQVTGTATRPGRLTVGVLLPVPGTWRLFLQTRISGKVVTAPFTLEVR